MGEENTQGDTHAPDIQSQSYCERFVLKTE